MDWDEVEKRLKKEAAAEEIQAQAARDAVMDRAFEKEAAEIFKLSPGEIEDLIGNIPKITDADVREAQAAIAKAKRAMKGGNRAKAEKILMSNRGIKEVRAAKKGKGCTVVALLFLGSSVTAIGTLWAAAEVLMRVIA